MSSRVRSCVAERGDSVNKFARRQRSGVEQSVSLGGAGRGDLMSDGGQFLRDTGLNLRWPATVHQTVAARLTCPPNSPGYKLAPACAANSVGVRFPSALWGRTSL